MLVLSTKMMDKSIQTEINEMTLKINCHVKRRKRLVKHKI